MAEDSANPLTPMGNGTNADQWNDHDHAIAEGNAHNGVPVVVDGNAQPRGNAPADGNDQCNGYAPSNGDAQPMGYAPANGYAAPQPNGGIPANGYTGSRPYTPVQPTQSMPYMQPAQPMQPVQPMQSGPFLSQRPTMQSQQPTAQSRQSGDKPQMDASKILQYVTLGISIIALILGIVANVHVVKPYRIASVAASKPTGSANSEKDSDAKNSAKNQKDSDSKTKSESGSTDGDSSKDFSGAGIKGKYVGTVNGEEMYELDLPGRRSGDSKSSNNKGYTVSADSKLKGDYKLGDHKMHLEITNFEADDTSATLTTEVTNTGNSEGIAGFGASLSQNDEAVDIGAIGSASKTIEHGHKETFTTKFRINDPSQPITITVHLAGEKMIATFTPRS